MTLKLRFVQLDVFTTTRFLGNPLAIVHLADGDELPQAQKQRIAAEFNLSETVFLHETSNPNVPVTIDIFTTTEELPFAGHPTVGSGWHLLSQAPEKGTVTLRTKAGDIPVIRGDNRVRLQVPIDFKVHEPFAQPGVKTLQPQLKDGDYVNGKDGAEAMASIVKGMTFVLLQLSSEEALAAMQPYPSRFYTAGLGEWAGFLGVYAFFEREDGTVRTRMFDGSLEDPATGSAASTLAGWLARKKGQGSWKIEIIQGVEMGRKSEISVEVEVGAGGDITRIDLGGTAVEVMEGWIQVGW
ncbi:putative phenazine biosynthesis-like protein [Lyophyllum shimeji]|uniref:Phenazine biosynthesis-like protein n=1 Tax=Lyophyllum shimeji TaxID=47721 RepID=A0A9P3PL83_LYOSH|nr:putative phenazine biosynthesis-like protein [Lyophyllum shimeji]